MLTETASKDSTSALRRFYQTGKTQALAYRIQQLRGIQRFLIECEQDIETALYQDLRKPPIEAFMTETAMLLSELKYTLKHLSAWTKSKRVTTPLSLQPGRSRIYPEPLGVVLIIAPWNYPLQLTLSPLIGALAAGNCVVIKPSEMAPATSQLLATRLPQYIDNSCLTIIEGDVSTVTDLLAEKFDYIFFTGGSAVGKIIMKAAAEHLTPVTLELGGKSPCIVDETANLDVAARRITWTKFANAGQTCVAPDYILVHETVENNLIEKIKQSIIEFYSAQPETSQDYGRIVNLKHFQRLTKLFTGNGQIAVGGQTDETGLYIAPTILRNVPLNASIMQDEIFGPILPIIRYSELRDAIQFINAHPKPLALYVFTANKQNKDKIINETSSGGVCINHAMLQVGVLGLPFGGVGMSGMGAYHGKASFDTFTHYKSVFDKATWFDPAFVYPPYKEKLRALLRWLI